MKKAKPSFGIHVIAWEPTSEAENGSDLEEDCSSSDGGRFWTVPPIRKVPKCVRLQTPELGEREPLPSSVRSFLVGEVEPRRLCLFMAEDRFQ